jgi:predicted lipid-binding transport protein (Tim44 family)
MGQFLDISNIIFLVLAVAIFLRLRSVLGRKTGNERPPADPFAKRERMEGGARPDRSERDNVVSLPSRTGEPAAANDDGKTDGVGTPEPDTALDRALRSIVSADRDFDQQEFLHGAEAAYEMIVTAFATGDVKTLKGLLSREVFDGFVVAIQDREKRGETVESTFVGIDKVDIVEAYLRGSTVQITVRFVSQLITATRDKEGTIVDGDPTKVSELVDVWTFERAVNSPDPTWFLVATKSPE